MSTSPRKLANDASFQAFMNCYLREVDSGTWIFASDWQERSQVRLAQGETHVAILKFPARHLKLAIGVRFRSCVGRHSLTQVFVQRRSSREWNELDSVSALLFFIDTLYEFNQDSDQRLELISRVIESHRVMEDYLSSYAHRPAHERKNGFIDSEQSIILGHWLHPTPKSRQGIQSWQHEHYTPELRGQFQLHFFAASRKIVEQLSLEDESAEEIGRRIALQDPDPLRVQKAVCHVSDGYCLLPAHPLQAQWLLHQEHVRTLLHEKSLVDLGALGPLFTPTSSVRTVYSEACDYMLKLSIPVKLTNSLRINKRSDLGNVAYLSQLLRKLNVLAEHQYFSAIEDPAYITIALPDRVESGFEVVYRKNPFIASEANAAPNGVHSIAALVQDPLAQGERSQLAAEVHALADREGATATAVARKWFAKYFEVVIESAIKLCDRYGLGLEAHQQNVLLGFSSDGYPARFYYRDIQGLVIAASYRTELLSLVPELADHPRVFEPDQLVKSGFGYYLIHNQLYAIVNRLALDGLASERDLLQVMHSRLTTLRSSLSRLGAEFVDDLLSKRALPCKANLRTRVVDLDELQAEHELAVYTLVDNPLSEISSGTAPMPTHEHPATLGGTCKQE